MLRDVEVIENDRQLVARMLAGDGGAFNDFFHTYAPRLLSFALRRTRREADAEDVVQKSITKAMQGLDRWRADSSLFSWLCSICTHELVDEYRREQRRVPTLALDADAAVRESVLQLRSPADANSAAVDSANDIAVNEVLARLPEHYRCALEWKYGDELSVDEIGRLLGMTHSAAESVLARARAAFREAWEGRSAAASCAHTFERT